MKLAFPCILEQLLIVSVSVMSTIIMGHVGKNEMTAVSMVNSLVTWLQFLYLGLATGVTVIIGRLYGEENHEGVKEATMQSLKIALIISGSISLLGFIFSDGILNLFFSSATPEVAKHLKIYYSYSIVSLPFIAFNYITNAAARGVGDNRLALVTNVLVNALYTLFAYILIFGITYFGFPTLSTHGTGIAVFAARAIGPVIGVIMIKAKKIAIFPKNLFARAKENYIKRIFSISIYTSLEQGIYQGGAVILQSLYLIYGATFQAGYQISTSILGIFNAVTSGISVAITVATTQALARHDFVGASDIFRFVKKMFFVALIPAGAFLFTFGPYISHLYSTEADVLATAGVFCRIYGVCFCMINYQTLAGGILRGAGDARYITVTSTAALWVARILPVFILSTRTSGYVALGLGIVLNFATMSLIYHFRLRKGAWLHIKV